MAAAAFGRCFNRHANSPRATDQDEPQAHADKRRLPPRSPACARRGFKRKNGGFWRAQFLYRTGAQILDAAESYELAAGDLSGPNDRQPRVVSGPLALSSAFEEAQRRIGQAGCIRNLVVGDARKDRQRWPIPFSSWPRAEITTGAASIPGGKRAGRRADGQCHLRLRAMSRHRHLVDHLVSGDF